MFKVKEGLRLFDNQTTVRISRIKDGGPKKPFYERTMSSKETKEI